MAQFASGTLQSANIIAPGKIRPIPGADRHIQDAMPNSIALPSFTPPEWARQFVLASIYAMLIYLGDALFESQKIVAHLELASGFALASLLIWGESRVLAILLGAAAAHVALGASYTEIAIVASSDAVEAWLGYRLLMHGEKLDLRLQSLRAYLRLILVGGCVSIAVSALTANILLATFGLIPSEEISGEALHWWMSDTLGFILVTPLILVWWKSDFHRENRKQVVEAVLLIGLTTLVGQIVFFDWLHDALGGTPKGYWMFMLIAWVAIFLGGRGTTIALIVVAVQALFGAIQGVGYFAEDVERMGLINYWFYILTLSLVGMSLATYVLEIKNANFAVAHRDALIREIHHRIKNNMQGITGLLRRLAEDHPDTRDAINQTIGQVQSIATIHGLQGRSVAEKVELGELACGVAKSVGRLWGVRLDAAVPQDWRACIVAPAEAIPLALILNELLSNAVKHGGQVTLGFEHGRVADAVNIVIRNVENPAPDTQSESGAGLQLVESLMPRQGARMSMQYCDGMVVTALELEPPVIMCEAQA